MADTRSGSQEYLAEPLTQREQEILAFLADGLTNQEIADKLYLAPKTVRWYNTQIYSKLGVNKRVEAVERAQQLGLLIPSSPTLQPTGKHNLPPQATLFVGRQHELAELIPLLNDQNTRLITLLAPGGMGKTRLSIEAARLQVGRYPDGVIFVPLAPLSSPQDIVTTIAEAIGFSFYGENAPAQQLIDFLRDRSVLLVLDNFEHLLEGAPLVADLVQAAPDVRILVTSREKLNLHAETVYALRGLEFPAWETPQDALAYDAVRLFLQSAHRVRPDFELEVENLDFLARICRLTEGMPLGIELAAGWVDVLSLEQIAVELQQGIDILETEMRDVPERHRSLRATFDRTWERLTNAEQQMFMRLSVFRGGFTVAAAQTVAGAGVRSLRQLANKALVQVSPDGRHNIHELLRQFGAEKLAVSGEQATIEAKHTGYFAEFMAERKQDMCTNRQLEALELIDPDFDNVRSAWLFVVNQHEWEQLPNFLHSLWFYLDVRTRGREGVELLEQAVNALQSVPSSTETDLALGRMLARLSWFYNDTGFSKKGVATCDEAIRILRQYDSRDDLMAALQARALIAWFLVQPDIAVSMSQEGLNLARLIGDKYWEGYFLIWSGFSIIWLDDFVSALQLAEEGLRVFEALGDRWGLMGTYKLLADIRRKQQDELQTKQLIEKALKLAETFGHIFGVAEQNISLAQIALKNRNYGIARLHLTKALRLWWNAGYKLAACYSLVYIAEMFAGQDELDRAVEILAAFPKAPLSLFEADRANQAMREKLEANMEAERFAAAWERGEKRELSAVVAELLAEGQGE